METHDCNSDNDTSDDQSYNEKNDLVELKSALADYDKIKQEKEHLVLIVEGYEKEIAILRNKDHGHESPEENKDARLPEFGESTVAELTMTSSIQSLKEMTRSDALSDALQSVVADIEEAWNEIRNKINMSEVSKECSSERIFQKVREHDSLSLTQIAVMKDRDEKTAPVAGSVNDARLQTDMSDCTAASSNVSVSQVMPTKSTTKWYQKFPGFKKPNIMDSSEADHKVLQKTISEAVDKYLEATRRKLDEKQEEVKTLKADMVIIHETYNKYIQELRDSKFAMQKQLEEVNDVRQLNASSRDEEKMKKQQEDINHLHQCLDKTTKSLSKQMHKNLSRDESALENINTENRPSKIAEEYSEVLTNEWLSAKDSLDTIDPEGCEENKTKFLCDIIFKGYSFAETYLNEYLTYLNALLRNPFNAPLCKFEEDYKCGPFDVKVMGEDLYQSLTIFLKDRGQIEGLEHLSPKFMKTLPGEAPYQNMAEEPSLEQFARAVIGLSWRMLLQKPAMTFASPNMEKTPKRTAEEIYAECPKYKQCVISSYVSPLLMQGSSCLVKGKAFVREAQFN